MYRQHNDTGNVELQARGGHKQKLLSEEQIDSVKDWLDEDCTLRLDDIRIRIREQFNIVVSIPTVSKYITAFHYSFKRLCLRPIPALTEESFERRRVFAEWYIRQNGNQREFIWADETGFKVSMRPHYGRALVGQTPIKQGATRIRTRNITVMAAMNANGILHFQVLREQNGNRDAYLHFLDDVAHNRDARGVAQNAILIVDNVPFHKGPIVNEMMENRGFEWEFLPAYSPFFNPIVNLFSKWKALVKRAEPGNEAELFEAIDAAAALVTEADCRGYIRHLHSNCMDCLNGVRNLV